MMQKGGPEETAGELYPTEEWGTSRNRRGEELAFRAGDAAFIGGLRVALA
jgi:hypothetical protein